MNKQFLAVVSVVILVLVGVFIFTKKDSNEPGGSSSNEASNHIVGEGQKNVTLIEYGDFQCPACKSFHPIVQALKEEYNEEITFQFRHFPLIQIHPSAMLASRAAEAAGNQGKFFEMHDLLFENQESWSPVTNPASIFESYAEALGLDIEKFRVDSAGSGVLGVINADIREAQNIGASSTPTFVLNGEKIENPRSLEDFKKLIDEAIAKNS